MILYCTCNRELEVWHLDLSGQLARPPAAPAVYALVSFEADQARYYIGSSKRFTARMSAHISFARSRKLCGHSAGGRLLASAVARRRRVLVIVLETCAGVSTASLQRREQAWLIAATRACGAAALPLQVPATTSPARGPHAPFTLATRRQWPTDWIEALAGFFREPRRPQAEVRSAAGPSARRPVPGAKTPATKPAKTRRSAAAAGETRA